MSAGLLLFGLATIWLPPVRAALFGWPLATISVLVCLGLIFKFTRESGVAGLMTGGLLALFMIGAIVDDTQRRQQQFVSRASGEHSAELRASETASQSPAPANNASQQRPPVRSTITGSAPVSQPHSSIEVRELLAAHGAILKFVPGVPYQLKVRSGYITSLSAQSGSIASFQDGKKLGECVNTLTFSTSPASVPYQTQESILYACDTRDALFRVAITK